MRCTIEHLAIWVLLKEHHASSTNILELARNDVAVLGLNANRVITLVDSESDEVDLDISFASKRLEYRCRGEFDIFPEMKLKPPHKLLDGSTWQPRFPFSIKRPQPSSKWLISSL